MGRKLLSIKWEILSIVRWLAKPCYNKLNKILRKTEKNTISHGKWVLSQMLRLVIQLSHTVIDFVAKSRMKCQNWSTSIFFAWIFKAKVIQIFLRICFFSSNCSTWWKMGLENETGLEILLPVGIISLINFEKIVFLLNSHKRRKISILLKVTITCPKEFSNNLSVITII